MKRIKQLFSFILQIGVCLTLGMIIGRNSSDKSFPFFILSLVVLILCLFIGIIIHELGHLMFGLLSGYKFSSFRIANIMILKDKGTYRWTTYSIPGTAGQCLMVPPEDKKIPPYFWYNVGGGLLNLILAVIVWLAIRPGSDHPFLSIFANINAALGIINLIPMNTLVANDGYNILQLWMKKRARQFFGLQLKIVSALQVGRRYREMPEDYFELPKDSELDNTFMATGLVNRLNYELDTANYKHAIALLDQIIGDPSIALIELHRKMIVLERVFFYLMEGQIEAANGLMTKDLIKLAPQLAKSQMSINRFLYVYELVVNNNEERAQKWVDNFYKLAEKNPYKGEVANELQLLEFAQQKIKNV